MPRDAPWSVAVLVFVTLQGERVRRVRNRDLQPRAPGHLSPGRLSRSDVASPASANQRFSRSVAPVPTA